MNKRRKLYEAYLDSGHWKNLRQEAFERDSFKCLKCGSLRNLRGHHKKYRKNLWLCTVQDIETLCEKCHNRYHKEKKQLRYENRKAKNPDKRIAWFKLLTVPKYVIRNIDWNDN